MLTKLVVILGPTVSGKSSWAYRLAGKYKGEIISADSRQIYRHLDIGTNKDIGIWKKGSKQSQYYEVNGIKSHLIDFLDPEKSFSVYEYQKKCLKIIKDIAGRGKQPFLVGGTGFYIDSVVHNWKLAPKSFDKVLRSKLLKKSNIELWHELKKCDSQAAQRIDKHNKIRLIRALEINYLTGNKMGAKPKSGKQLFETLKIGIDVPRDDLYKKINKRVEQMFKKGLVDEVSRVRGQYDNNLPVFRGIGYRQLFSYFEGKISLDEAKEKIMQDTRKYSRRQMTWWRRDGTIAWCSSFDKADKLIATFLDN